MSLIGSAGLGVRCRVGLVAGPRKGSCWRVSGGRSAGRESVGSLTLVGSVRLLEVRTT